MHLSPRLVLLLILPPLLWAANAVFARIAINSIGPLWLNALRWGLALLILLPLGWKLLASTSARQAVGERWVYLGILGLIGVGAYNGLQYVALRTSTPVNVTLIASSLPLWSMIVGAVDFARLYGYGLATISDAAAVPLIDRLFQAGQRPWASMVVRAMT